MRTLTVALGILTMACSSNARVAATPEPAAEKSVAPPATPVGQAPQPLAEISPLEASKEWLNALRDHDDAKLDERTLFPFELRTTAKEGCRGVAKDASSFHQLIACLHAESSLEAELKQVSSFTVRAASELPTWARGLKPSTNETAVQSYINGDGITFQFVLLLNKTRTRMLFINTEIEGG